MTRGDDAMRTARPGRMSGWIGGLAALLAWAATAVADEAAPPPRRIVSLNLCTDQILLDLVPRARIAALSELVMDPALSGRVEAARGLALVRGHAEEVLALAPDVVIAGAFSTPATVDLLQRLGVRVVQVPMATDFAGIRRAVRAVAEAVGERAAGEAMIARFDRRLAEAAEATATDGNASPDGAAHGDGRPVAVVYHVNSLASGAGSLLDEIVQAAGYRNGARQMALGPAGRLPLETLVLDAPQVLVMATEAETYRTTAADNLRHPAFRELVGQRRTVHLPMPMWMCGTPDVADAVAHLAAMRPRPVASGPSRGPSHAPAPGRGP